MSRRAARIAFALVFVLIGSAIVFVALLSPAPPIAPRWLGVLVEVVVLIVGGAFAFTAPPDDYRPPSTIDLVDPSPPVPAAVYRGAQPAASPMPAVVKASAQRLTIGILAALLVTAAAVPFALHLPRWVEAEIVVGAWWTIWSVVLGVVAYRGTKIADDHRPGSGRVTGLDGDSPKWAWLLEASPDAEACLVAIVVFLVVGVALLGAWLVVELVAPAVFIVAYRGVVRALAKAQAANTRGNAVRSALSGMGWAAIGTAPLAIVVAIAHRLLTA
jgi:hypothetical protein